jgi:hypothetical protein
LVRGSTGAVDPDKNVTTEVVRATNVSGSPVMVLTAASDRVDVLDDRL